MSKLLISNKYIQFSWNANQKFPKIDSLYLSLFSLLWILGSCFNLGHLWNAILLAKCLSFNLNFKNEALLNKESLSNGLKIALIYNESLPFEIIKMIKLHTSNGINWNLSSLFLFSYITIWYLKINWSFSFRHFWNKYQKIKNFLIFMAKLHKNNVNVIKTMIFSTRFLTNNDIWRRTSLKQWHLIQIKVKKFKCDIINPALPIFTPNIENSFLKKIISSFLYF